MKSCKAGTPAASPAPQATFPISPAHIPAGIPAGLIERRPDLAAARARLFASAKRADAARKNLLPNFSLTGGSGSTGARFSDLLRTDFLVSTISGNVNQFLYDGGAREANARGALATNDRLVNEYAQLALEAFREVEATLSADRSLAIQEKFLRSEVEQATLAETQAERDYAEGINPNILSVLEAQRRANNARAAIIRLRNPASRTASTSTSPSAGISERRPNKEKRASGRLRRIPNARPVFRCRLKGRPFLIWDSSARRSSSHRSRISSRAMPGRGRGVVGKIL